VRLATYNVENLFDRAKVLSTEPWSRGRPVLNAFARLNDVIANDPYSDPDKAEIVDLLGRLGLLRGDSGRYAQLRRIRGSFLRRQRDGQVLVVAQGRSSWIGWVELTTEHVTELAMQHTAMVIRDVDADVLGVVEAESRPLLQMFTSAMLAKVGGRPYEQVMLIEGNDPRGIDVGLLARSAYPITQLRTHVFDTDPVGPVFSRDCCEYHLRTPDDERLVVLVNHLKSKGYGDPGDPIGARRRHRQATRVAEIYRGLLAEGLSRVAVIGDLNDDPASDSLAPLLAGTDLRDVSEHAGFDFGPRLGTFKGGNAKDKIDYILLSPALFERVTGGAVFRKGVYRGPRTRNPWETYPTLTAPVHEASDHAALYADLDL
jgi:endonuclease/exonuclease/phosphatase family metal-dependent hydrolase